MTGVSCLVGAEGLLVFVIVVLALHAADGVASDVGLNVRRPLLRRLRGGEDGKESDCAHFHPELLHLGD